jgi:hypothetical protein
LPEVEQNRLAFEVAGGDRLTVERFKCEAADLFAEAVRGRRGRGGDEPADKAIAFGELFREGFFVDFGVERRVFEVDPHGEIRVTIFGIELLAITFNGKLHPAEGVSLGVDPEDALPFGAGGRHAVAVTIAQLSFVEKPRGFVLGEDRRILVVAQEHCELREDVADGAVIQNFADEGIGKEVGVGDRGGGCGFQKLAGEFGCRGSHHGAVGGDIEAASRAAGGFEGFVEAEADEIGLLVRERHFEEGEFAFDPFAAIRVGLDVGGVVGVAARVAIDFKHAVGDFSAAGVGGVFACGGAGVAAAGDEGERGDDREGGGTGVGVR